MHTASAARIANDSPFCEAYAAMDKIVERLVAMVGERATAAEATRLLATDGTALLRDLLQGYFDRCAEEERRAEVVGADGIERKDARISSRRIETPVGEIEVKRLLYQAPGVDGIAPLDAALGLPDEKYTHELRRIVAEESAKSSFDEVVELVEKRTGGSVPKREVKELTVRAAQDFDAFCTACDDRDQVRPRPTNKRVWASAQRSAQGVIDDAFAEAHRRDPDHRRRWVVLVDGQRDQIKRRARRASIIGAPVRNARYRRSRPYADACSR